MFAPSAYRNIGNYALELATSVSYTMGDRPATECEVDEKEIEITSEMIEAGIEVLRDYFWDVMIDGGVSGEQVCEELLCAALKYRKAPASLSLVGEPLKSVAKGRSEVFVRL